MNPDPPLHHRRSIRLKGYDYSQAGAYFVTIVTQGRECLFGAVANGAMRLNPAGEMVEKWWFELENKFPTVALGAYAVMPNHFHGIIQIIDPIVGVDLRVDPFDPPRGDPFDPPRGDPFDPPRGDPFDLPRGGPFDPPRGDPFDPPRGGPIDPSRVDPDPNRGKRMDPDRGTGLPLPIEPESGGHAEPPLPTIIQWFKTMTTNEYIRGVKQLGWPPFDRRLWQRNYYEHIIRNEDEHDRIHRYIEANPSNWGTDSENLGK